MNFLTNWITQMIVLIFIMMLTLMVLPDRSMKKYAQFSLSIIFMFLFIQPITTLFNINISDESNKIVDSLFGSNSRSVLENEIDLKKKEIQATSDAYVIDEMANQLKAEMEDEFAQVFEYELKRVDIFSETDQAIVIEELVFHFTITDNNHQTLLIEPVIISASNHKIDHDQQTINDNQQILNWFSNKLSVNQNQIQISWEGG
ncbi:stage III sporulation protein AF [Amphibacillus indicireducens]|uniref:Stage III sporulation protein AF n=1 Tax=Amphibacillus indicireducens TaxID=1076330 RepID=A0ABP7VGP9_9BACI